MSRLRWGTLIAIGALVGCSGASTGDGGTDSGVVDAGTPVDAGTVVDAGTIVDAGPPGTFGCSGIANCVETAPSFSFAVIGSCEKLGTTAAQGAFTNLVGCAMGCASLSDGGSVLACIDVDIADGGMCASQWDTCQTIGTSCGAIVTCIEGLPAATQAAITDCISIGTGTAVGLAQTLVECETTACGTDGGCETASVGTGGACNSAFTACETDMSGG